MSWYKKRPGPTQNFSELAETYNKKYGFYDYTQDSRSRDTSFEETLVRSVGDLSDLDVLVCGSNAGYEIDILLPLYPTARFVAVDVAKDALQVLANTYPSVDCFQADMQSLPFSDGEFDVYLNCRAIHSSAVSIDTAIAEAKRVTKGRIVISVANGYLIDGEIVNGLYDYDSQQINKRRPYQIVSYVKTSFDRESLVGELSSEAELFVVFHVGGNHQ